MGKNRKKVGQHLGQNSGKESGDIFFFFCLLVNIDYRRIYTYSDTGIEENISSHGKYTFRKKMHVVTIELHKVCINTWWLRPSIQML